jgi:hypothetical protein
MHEKMSETHEKIMCKKSRAKRKKKISSNHITSVWRSQTKKTVQISERSEQKISVNQCKSVYYHPNITPKIQNGNANELRCRFE